MSVTHVGFESSEHICVRSHERAINILEITDYYVPGFKAGGSLRTLENLVESLGDEFHFNIITLDRDYGDPTSYPGVELESWQQVGKSKVFYIAAKRFSLARISSLIRSADYDVICLNSVFSPRCTLKPLLLRRLGIIPRVPLILFPRGELNKGAISIKSTKKRLFLAIARAIGLYKDILWQASTEYEVEDIHRYIGPRAETMRAVDLSLRLPDLATGMSRNKAKGYLKVVFLSRITPKKNLAGAIHMLKDLSGCVEMNVYGPIEDNDYWDECLAIANTLPPNIKFRHHGPVHPSEVVDIFRAHHLQLLPTLGENFGHVIFEALATGCPVLISDQTPWHRLQEQRCGWDLPLKQPDAFRRCLQECLDMDARSFDELSANARKCAENHVRSCGAVEQNRRLLYTAFSKKVAGSAKRLRL